MQQTIRKSVSWLLTLAMIFSMLPGFTFTVLAAEHLCAHHTEHTADCGYEAGVSDCTYHCDICLGHDHGEPAPAAVCTCESDDPDWHAPFCDAYVAPEDPQCYCVEVCGDFVNDYCDVCYFDAAACAASGEEEAALFADTPTYISKIAVAYGKEESTPKDILKNNGFTVIDYDLNKGCGDSSYYVYLGYKTTTNPSEAITGIFISTGENKPDSANFDGVTANLLGCSKETNPGENEAVDLNVKADGSYLYVYVTRNTSRAPLTEITFGTANSKSGYVTPNVNLNNGTSGGSIYLHYK